MFGVRFTLQGVSESLRRCLEQQGICTVFKSETTLRSHLVQTKDTVNPAKQDGAVYRFPVNAEKSTLGKQGDLCMRESKSTTGIQDSSIPRPLPFLSTPSHKTGHYPRWNKVKFIDQNSQWYTHRVKEAIHTRLHPNNTNRDSRIENPEAWMPTIKKHNTRMVQQWTTEGAATRRNSEDRNTPITSDHCDINGAA